MEGRTSTELDNEVQQAHERLRVVKRQELGLCTRQKHLEEQMLRLRDARDINSKEIRRFQSTELTAAIITYSRSSTLQLASKMRSTLPQELQNMIIDYLWDDDAISASIYWRKNMRIRCPGRPCECLRHVNIPHFLDPIFVGADIATLSSAVFFRKTMCILNRVDDITGFLYGDPLHNGFQPLGSVRSLTLKICLDRCFRKDLESFAEDLHQQLADLRVHTAERLAELPEPSRFKEWLRTFYEEDPGAEIGQRSLSSAYDRDFKSILDTRRHEKLLSGEDRIKNVPSIYSSASPMRIMRDSRHRYIVQGIRERELNVAASGFWFDTTLRDNLTSLLDIPNKRSFRLQIEIHQRYIRLNVFVKVMEIIEPVFQQFEEEGAHPTIGYTYDGDLPSNPISFDITEYFLDTDEWWKENILEALGPEEESIRSRYQDKIGSIYQLWHEEPALGDYSEFEEVLSTHSIKGRVDALTLFPSYDWHEDGIGDTDDISDTDGIDNTEVALEYSSDKDFEPE